MKRLLLAAAVLFCAAGFATSAVAQTNATTPVVATQLKVGGVLVPSGTVSFLPVDGNDNPLSVATADGAMNLSTARGFSALITSGAIAPGFTVPDMLTAVATVPNTPISYKVFVYNSVNKQTAIIRIPAENPVVTGSSAFALDHYAPLQSVVLSATGLTSGSTVPAHCTVPSIFYSTTPNTAPYRCYSGTFVQDSVASGGSGNFTASAYNSLLGLPNSAGTTNAALWATGVNTVTAGQGGATDTICPPFMVGGVGHSTAFTPGFGQAIDVTCGIPKVGSGLIRNSFYFNNGTPQTGYGGGFFTADQTFIADNTVGTSLFGAWHTAHGHDETFEAHTEGIKQQIGNTFVDYAPGDDAWLYTYFNYRPGGAITGADEGKTAFTINTVPLGTYKAVANADYAANVNDIFTTQTSLCGEGGDGLTHHCIANGLVALKLGSAQQVTVTAMTRPSATDMGTMTVAETLTPVVASATITDYAPTTTNFRDGDRFPATGTETLTNIVGTFPSGTQVGCWWSTDWAESVHYTVSGSSVVILDHRRFHNGNSHLVAGDCSWFDSQLDYAGLRNNHSAFLVIPIDTHTLAWTTYRYNSLAGMWLDSGEFHSGVTGKNLGWVFQGAEVVSVADPAAVANSGGANSTTDGVTGYMKLMAHTWSLAAGDAIEEAYQPASSVFINNMRCNFLMLGDNDCNYSAVTGPFSSVYDIRLNNQSGLGAYSGGGQIFNVQSDDPIGSGSYGNVFRVAQAPAHAFAQFNLANDWPKPNNLWMFDFGNGDGLLYKTDIRAWVMYAGSVDLSQPPVTIGKLTVSNSLTIDSGADFNDRVLKWNKAGASAGFSFCSTFGTDNAMCVGNGTAQDHSAAFLSARVVGVRNPGGLAEFYFGGAAGDPSPLFPGDEWSNTSENRRKYRDQNNVTQTYANLNDVAPSATSFSANTTLTSTNAYQGAAGCNGVTVTLPASPKVGETWTVYSTNATTACTVASAAGIGNSSTATTVSLASNASGTYTWNGQNWWVR